jgi:formate dehydrogenase iron-sulfur subunit
MIARNDPKLSRRDFLKTVGAGIAAATTAGLFASQAYPARASEKPAQQTWAMLIDLTRCTGCNSCALACKESNGLPAADGAPQALDSETFTFVDARQVITPGGEIQTRFVKRQCMHCLNAACVSACPAAAMYSSGQGPVVYRPNRCLGCRYCQVACPFEVPRFEWDNGINPQISKCWLCYDRLQAGQKPACVEACPTGTLRFGQREDLLAQAHAQIASNPGRYVDHVFGEFEVGGTSMLYLSDVAFEQLGFPGHLPQTAPPEETEKIMSKLPFVIGGVVALMTGTAVYTHRAPAEATQSQPPDDGEE